jgi:PAS domain S-box-containing protein
MHSLQICPMPQRHGSGEGEKHRLLLLLDHNLDFLELTGSGGIIQGLSTTITTHGGYKSEELIGRHYQEIIHPEDCNRAAAAFADVLDDGHAGPVTVRYRRKDQSWRTVLATYRNFLTDPAVHAIVVLTRDVTDQLIAEASLAHANRELHRLSQQLMVAHETERSHIARELHDDVQQILFGLLLSMLPSSQSPAEGPSEERVRSWRLLVEEAFEHLRSLTLSLRPPVLNDRGLVAELRAHVDRLCLTSSQDIRLDVGPHIGRLAEATELACFRIVQESVANALRHASALMVRVSLRRTAGALVITIRDDGCGFDVAAASARAGPAGKIGLLSMRERAALMGGDLAVQSFPGHGSIVRASIPIAACARSSATPATG